MDRSMKNQERAGARRIRSRADSVRGEQRQQGMAVRDQTIVRIGTADGAPEPSTACGGHRVWRPTAPVGMSNPSPGLLIRLGPALATPRGSTRSTISLRVPPYRLDGPPKDDERPSPGGPFGRRSLRVATPRPSRATVRATKITTESQSRPWAVRLARAARTGGGVA